MTKQKGFTLLEILIALTVFSILAIITSSVLYYSFQTKERISQQVNRLTEIQLALTLIQRDTEQTLERPVRGDAMHLFSAFIGLPHYLELTRSGIANPYAQEKRSNLQRIAYLCRNNQLLRRTWPVLDSTKREVHEDNLLLNNLSHCQFAYLNQHLEIYSRWREQANNPLPKAIQFNLTLNDWGNINFLAIIPEATYE